MVKNPTAFERISIIAAIAAASTACLALVAGSGSIADRAAAAGAAAARVRLERAAAVRYESSGPERDERFDTLVSSLVAGLGTDTPAALGPALERIEAARAAERAADAGRTDRAGVRPRPEPVTVNPEVDRALADALRLLEREEATTPGARIPPGAAQTLSLTAAGLAVAGVVSAVAASRSRRAERNLIAEIIACPARAVHTGGLAAAVSRFLDGERERERRAAREGRNQPPPIASAREPLIHPGPAFETHFDPATLVDATSGNDPEFADDEPADVDDGMVPGFEGAQILEIVPVSSDEAQT